MIDNRTYAARGNWDVWYWSRLDLFGGTCGVELTDAVVRAPLAGAEITHLCAPTFILLAGISLALSDEKRRGQPGQTRFIVTRGLFIAALDSTGIGPTPRVMIKVAAVALSVAIAILLVVGATGQPAIGLHYSVNSDAKRALPPDS